MRMGSLCNDGSRINFLTTFPQLKHLISEKDISPDYISRFYIIANSSNLVRKHFQDEGTFDRITTFVENVFTTLFQKEAFEIVFLRSAARSYRRN